MRDPISPAEEKWLRRALAVIRFVRHPAFPGIAVMTLLAVAGFVAVGVAWYQAAGLFHVALQLPHFVSGGIGGLALIAAGLGLFYIQMGRRDAALEQRMNAEILQEVALLIAAAPRLRQIVAAKR